MADINTDFYPTLQPNALLGTAGSVVDLARGALAARQAHQDLVKGQVDYLANGLGALASKADLSADDLLGFGKRAVDEGVLDPNTFAVEMQQVQAAGNDPQKLRALATQYQLRALDAGQKFTAQFGTAGTIDTGNTVQPVTTSALTGIHPIGEPIQKTLSPSELATPTTIGTTPQGQPITGTTGQLLEKAGVNPLTALPPSAGPAGNALTGQASVAPLAAPSPQPAQGVVTTLPAGEVKAQEAVGESAGQSLAADLRTAANYQNAVTPLEKAIPALEALGSTGTGPGTEQINEIKSFLQSMGAPIADTDQIKNFDEARKYLVQFARGGGTGGDPNTNDKLAAAFEGNPSVGISNAASVDVAKTALSLARLQNAQVRQFQQSGQPEGQYSKWSADFNAKQDPRAYGFDLMSPENRAKLIQGMTPEEKAKFVQSLRTAISLGLVTQPNG